MCGGGGGGGFYACNAFSQFVYITDKLHFWPFHEFLRSYGAIHKVSRDGYNLSMTSHKARNLGTEIWFRTNRQMMSMFWTRIFHPRTRIIYQKHRTAEFLVK